MSTATVSRALRGLPNVSDKTRARVRRAADELGYVASSSASGLASGRTLAMGVVVPSVSRWFYTTVLEGVEGGGVGGESAVGGGDVGEEGLGVEGGDECEDCEGMCECGRSLPRTITHPF